MPFQRESAYVGARVQAPEAQIVRTAEQQISFVRRVYAWMFAGVLATVMGVAIAVKSGLAESLLYSGFLVNILLIVAWMGGAYALQRVRNVPTWNVVAFAGYGLLTGIVISSIVYVAIALAKVQGAAPGTYVLQAGGLTLVTFGGLSAYAFFTKRDFSFLRGMLTVGTFALLGALVIGFFVHATAFQMLISVFGVVLFAGYTLYDTQKVLRTFPDGEHVAGAMTLFLDFVLMFVYILRIVLLIASGGSRD
ncbi:MAG: Bax inhibitor-1/YccA family protein [Deltaproteobacteria bacterium]|nr:MAG: Bax inhibitor-1/YccA family protein [Deltaproteobacteria bacterium]